MKLIAGFILGILAVPVAIYLYFAFGAPPVATGEVLEPAACAGPPSDDWGAVDAAVPAVAGCPSGAPVGAGSFEPAAGCTTRVRAGITTSRVWSNCVSHQLRRSSGMVKFPA